jgi:hypothetical protein
MRASSLPHRDARAVGGVLLLTGGLAAVIFGSPREPSAQRVPATAVERRAEPPRAPRRTSRDLVERRSWGAPVVGERASYALRLDQTATLEGGAAGESSRSTVNGVLHVCTRATSSATSVLTFDLEATTVVEGAGDAVPIDLAGTAWIEVDAQGTTTRMMFPSGADDSATHLWREIVSRWRVVRPFDPQARTWSIEEDDGLGRYRAEYRRRDDADAVVVEKRVDASGAELGHEGGRGEATRRAVARFDGLLVSIEVEDTHRVELGSTGAALVQTSRFSLALRERGACAAEDYQSARTRVRAGSAPSTPRAAPVPTMSEVLDAIEAGLLGGEAADVPLVSLRDLVDRLDDPAAVRAASERARRDDASDGMVAAILGALAASGSAPAQRALGELARDGSWAAARRRTALLSIAAVERPDPDFDEVLAAIANERSVHAETALRVAGAVGSRSRADARRVERVRAVLTSALARPDEGARRAALDGWANLAIEPTAAVLDSIRDPNEAVRRSAVRAVGAGGNERALEVLRATSLNDPSPAVRRATMIVLGGMPLAGARATLTDALANDPDATVRRAAAIAIEAHDRLARAPEGP